MTVTATALGLWFASERLGRTATALADAVEGVNTAQEIRSQLRIFRRQFLIREIPSRGRGQREIDRAENRLGELFDQFEKYISDRRERSLAEEAEHRVNAYLRRSDALRSRRVPGVRIYRATSEPFESAVDAIQSLIDINVEQARVLQRQANVADGTYKWLAIFAVTLVLGLMALAVWLFHRLIYLPLHRLREDIGTFSAGHVVHEIPLYAVEEIAEISETFRNLALRLGRQKEDQVRYLAAVAHDLKNPLGAIRMSLELLGPSEGASEDERADIVALMERQVTQLNRLVNDVLDTARIEAGHMDLKMVPTDLRDLVEDSVFLFGAVSTSHHLVLEVPEADVPVECDPQRLGQVVNNLLSNAIKYSPDGGTVTVQLKKVVGPQGESAELSVSDEGVGISEEDLPRIFEPFQRGVSSREKFPGVGLGLSTAKRIIEAHRGDISTRSVFHKGTTFTIRIPLRLEAALSVGGAEEPVKSEGPDRFTLQATAPTPAPVSEPSSEPRAEPPVEPSTEPPAQS